MATCGVCGKNSSTRIIANIHFCKECYGILSRIRSGDHDLIVHYLTSSAQTCATPEASQYLFTQANYHADAVLRYEEEKKRADLAESEERQKQEFANSFEEHYEYDVVTAVNTIDGRTDAGKLKEILQEKAHKGWKLHTMYSNELGKNAIGILGIGINATASEDVMIFERRVKGNQ